MTYQGEEFEGRHEALIDEDLFGRVQGVLESRSVAKERRRVHHHYLKGSLFCGRCAEHGNTQRLIIQHTVNSRGNEYTYFFCRNKQEGTCPTPHINVLRIEDAVEHHYATVRFSADFIADVREHIAGTLADQEGAARLLKQQLTTQLRGLDAKESNLIDLAADSSLPQLRIKQKLREIQRERERLTERLQTTNDDLSDGARLVEACLQLLSEPQELYRRCDDEQRRLLNQAIFLRLTSTETRSLVANSASQSIRCTRFKVPARRQLRRPSDGRSVEPRGQEKGHPFRGWPFSCPP